MLKRQRKSGRVSQQKRVLIVEDDPLIAMELSERLGEMGYVVLGPAYSITEAEALLLRERPDAALLDANVAGQSSVSLGAALARQGVPVIFCTGYDEIRNRPAELAAALVLTKPVSEADLGAALKKVVAG